MRWLFLIFVSGVLARDCCAQWSQYSKEWEEGVDEYLFNGEGDYIGFDPNAKEIYAETIKKGNELMSKAELPPGIEPYSVAVTYPNEPKEVKETYKKVEEMRAKKKRILAGLEEEEKHYKVGYF